MSGTPWTIEQDAVLIANHRKMPAHQIAASVGRTMSAVHQRLNKLGLAERRKSRPKLAAFVKRLHKRGWSDTEMATEWSKSGDQITRYVIREARYRLGLPHNAYSAHRRQRVAEKTREQCQKAGVTSLAWVRRQAYDDFARRQGWPEDLRPRAVQICKLLYERGPHTRRQMVAAIGMRWTGSRRSLKAKCRGGSYLADLIARGLVIQLPRRVKQGKGKGNTVYLYAIAPTVRRGETA